MKANFINGSHWWNEKNLCKWLLCIEADFNLDTFINNNVNGNQHQPQMKKLYHETGTYIFSPSFSLPLILSFPIFHFQGYPKWKKKKRNYVANHASTLNKLIINFQSNNFRTNLKTWNGGKFFLIFMVIKGEPKRQHIWSNQLDFKWISFFCI